MVPPSNTKEKHLQGILFICNGCTGFRLPGNIFIGSWWPVITHTCIYRHTHQLVTCKLNLSKYIRPATNLRIDQENSGKPIATVFPYLFPSVSGSGPKSGPYLPHTWDRSLHQPSLSAHLRLILLVFVRLLNPAACSCHLLRLNSCEGTFTFSVTATTATATGCRLQTADALHVPLCSHV